jgi:hypothetical protein
MDTFDFQDMDMIANNVGDLHMFLALISGGYVPLAVANDFWNFTLGELDGDVFNRNFIEGLCRSMKHYNAKEVRVQPMTNFDEDPDLNMDGWEILLFQATDTTLMKIYFTPKIVNDKPAVEITIMSQMPTDQ